jgi:hypothetical protein
MYSDVEDKLKKGNKVLFSRDSLCLQPLIRLIGEQNHRTLVLWALDCAETLLAKFEVKYPLELRPRLALEKCDEWARGLIKMPAAKRAILDAHTVAKEIDDAVYIAICHAIGHAGAAVHVETHALGLVFYELTAVVLENRKSDCDDAVQIKIDNYVNRLLYWQEHIVQTDRQWADFLLDDSRPNKEKLLNKKSDEKSIHFENTV